MNISLNTSASGRSTVGEFFDEIIVWYLCARRGLYGLRQKFSCCSGFFDSGGKLIRRR